MKNLILSIAVVIAGSVTLNAQTESIEANYVMKMNMNVDAIVETIPKAYQAEARRNLETANKEGIFMDYTLASNGKVSVFKMIEKISNDNSMAGQVIQMMTMMDKEPLYKMIEEKQYSKLYDVWGQRYQIKDELTDFQWKITREKSKVAGYDVTKATGVINDSIPVTAWFAPQLKFKDGPDRFWGLPGLIVKVESEVDRASFTYELKDINISNKEIKITQPSEKKTYTMKEYEAAMKEFEIKMREQMDQGVDTN